MHKYCNAGLYTHMQKTEEKKNRWKESISFLDSILHRSSCEYWELINRKATIAICLVCVPPLVFSLSEVYSTYSSIHQHIQKHIPLFQLPSMKTWRACVHWFHCQCIKMLYMLLHCKWFNNRVVCLVLFKQPKIYMHYNRCRIWVWCVWWKTQQQLIATVTEFQSSSFGVNRRRPVNPNATSAVIHKAKQFFNSNLCFSICMTGAPFHNLVSSLRLWFVPVAKAAP